MASVDTSSSTLTSGASFELGGGSEKSRAAISDSVTDESFHFRMTLEAEPLGLDGVLPFLGDSMPLGERKRISSEFSFRRQIPHQEKGEDTYEDSGAGLPLPLRRADRLSPSPPLRRAFRASTFFAMSSVS